MWNARSLTHEAFSTGLERGMLDAMAIPKVFAYARLPSGRMATESTRELIAQAGYAIHGRRLIEEEVPRCVTASKRVGLQNLLSRMEKGDSLIVMSMDNIGLNVADVLKTIKNLKERGIGLVVLELGRMDLTARAGQMVIRTLVAAAELERGRMSACSQVGQARAQAEGRHIGRPSKTSAEERQEIRDLLEQGLSVSEVARRFSVPGGRTLGRTTVAKIKNGA